MFFCFSILLIFNEINMLMTFLLLANNICIINFSFVCAVDITRLFYNCFKIFVEYIAIKNEMTLVTIMIAAI